jgi:PAS domain S-box-containing protein
MNAASDQPNPKESLAHMYLNLVRAIPDIVYVLDDRGCFVYLNEAAATLGFSPASLIGKHFTEIIHPEDRSTVSRDEVMKRLKGTVTGDERSPKLFDERRSGSRMTRNLEVRLLGGEGGALRYGSVNAYGEVDGGELPFPGIEGNSLCTVGIIRDITEARAREKSLKEALEARDILLKEVHHRVKNNLQVVSSLLSLHESEIEDPDARRVFQDCRTQIQSMAMVHEALYKRESLTGVDMNSYLTRLAWYLSEIYEGARRDIQTKIETDQCVLGVDQAVTLALIVNELISNSYKYAFKAGVPGEIHISLRREGDEWLLELKDRVIEREPSGLVNPGNNQAAPRNGKMDKHGSSGGIGNDLVRALAMQLHGGIDRVEGGGTTIMLRFPS